MTAKYLNKTYNTSGKIGTIEIKPRDNKVCDRLSLLELRQYIEDKIPSLSKYLSNTNVYEVGMLDTYQKYKLQQEGNKDIKLENILERAKGRKDFTWLNEANKEGQGYEGEGEER